MTRKRFLTINPQIRDYFGSIKTSLVFSSLEYWCNKKPQGFYKFKQPCLKHPLYKKGDSWGEELDMKRKVLDSILATLVTSYSSKTDFLKAKDKFKGKIFASYLQRNTNQTFYFMDREALDTFYAKLDTKRPPSSTPLCNDPISLDKSTFGSAPKNIPFAQAVNTNTNTHNKTTLTEVELISQKMIDTWNSHLPHKAIWYKSSASKLFQILQDFFSGCIENFKRYCLSAASADFLTGKIGAFKAYFYWAIKPEIIQRIITGAYGVKVLFTVKTNGENKIMEDNSENGFEALWDLFLRKGNKEVTKTEYELALQEITHENLLLKLKAYNRESQRMISSSDLKFIKFSNTWLSDRFWDRDYGDFEIDPSSYYHSFNYSSHWLDMEPRSEKVSKDYFDKWSLEMKKALAS